MFADRSDQKQVSEADVEVPALEGNSKVEPDEVRIWCAGRRGRGSREDDVLRQVKRAQDEQKYEERPEPGRHGAAQHGAGEDAEAQHDEVAERIEGQAQDSAGDHEDKEGSGGNGDPAGRHTARPPWPRRANECDDDAGEYMHQAGLCNISKQLNGSIAQIRLASRCLHRWVTLKRSSTAPMTRTSRARWSSS